MLEQLRAATRIGFVFSGGSARCAFQIGAVEALSALGIKPAITFGVSAGAWNAALVAAKHEHRMRYYWRSFMRMPNVDLRNLLIDHSPWRYRLLHRRNFDRYVGRTRLAEADALPMFVSVTRLRDSANEIINVCDVDDPLELLLATNYFWPFYTHPPSINGERYVDGGLSDNAPYERALAEGCDAVVVMAQKGESEGGLFKARGDYDHVVSDPRVIVIRPHHRLPFAFNERRWDVLAPLIRVGYLRTREVLLGERHVETQLRAKGEAPSATVRRLLRPFSL